MALFRKERPPSLGEMLKGDKPPEIPPTEMTLEDWERRRAENLKQAQELAQNTLSKIGSFWRGLKDRAKNGLGWVLTAPEMAKYGIDTAIERVANVNYDRVLHLDPNLQPGEGGRVENVLAAADAARDSATSAMRQRAERVGVAARTTAERARIRAQEQAGKAKTYLKQASNEIHAAYGEFRRRFYDGLNNIQDQGKRTAAKIEAAGRYTFTQIEKGLTAFKAFLEYHSPAKRRERAVEHLKQQVEELRLEGPNNVFVISPAELMQLLRECGRHGIEVRGIRVQVGREENRPPETKDLTGSQEARLAV